MGNRRPCHRSISSRTAYPARSHVEFDALIRQHLDAMLDAFGRATAFVLTLGLTEAWESTIDGAVYPACPGTIAGTFDPARHRFHNFTSSETRDDLTAFIERLRSFNPRVRFILTVSPVPLVATATDQHVLAATTYSKAALRVAAEEVVRSVPGVIYFPAFEILTGPQAPFQYYDTNRRDVTPEAIGTVMAALLARSESAVREPVGEGAERAPSLVERQARQILMAEAIGDAECDELMVDPESVAR